MNNTPNDSPQINRDNENETEHVPLCSGQPELYHIPVAETPDSLGQHVDCAEQRKFRSPHSSIVPMFYVSFRTIIYYGNPEFSIRQSEKFVFFYHPGRKVRPRHEVPLDERRAEQSSAQDGTGGAR